ncbi:hypothetical protein ECP030230812_4034 [Escherichia coli P0302308.12]|nr:hypothetical protein ECP030230812_4034 [Escherichia coli P0302308.12]
MRRKYDEYGRLIQETPLTAISPATVMIIHTVTPCATEMPPAAGKP